MVSMLDTTELLFFSYLYQEKLAEILKKNQCSKAQRIEYCKTPGPWGMILFITICWDVSYLSIANLEYMTSPSKKEPFISWPAFTKEGKAKELKFPQEN